MNIIKQVLIMHEQGESNRGIARALSLSKNTVNRYVALAREDKLSIKELLALDDPELDFRFNGGRPAYADRRLKDFMERLPVLEREMHRPHMTLKLLWEEYRQEVPDGYSLTQFCFHWRQNAAACKGKGSTLLKDLYKGGDQLMLDYAGDKMHLVDPDTGEVRAVELFVAVLPASDYLFAMAVPGQTTEDFCYALECCLQHLGGVPRRLVPDNLKAAVIKAGRYEVKLNAALAQLANHYHCAVDPARVRHPRDKALVENAVKLAYRRICAPLRDRIFYDLDSLNRAIARLVAAHNAKRVQGADYSRQERFAAVDKPLLQPLPAERFELVRTVQIKVAKNSYVKLGCDKHYYSVPFQYIGSTATVRYTATMVRILIGHECVATHRRERKPGGYTYEREHLPSHSLQWRELSPLGYIERAGRICSSLQRVMEMLFSGDTPPEVHYRSADGLMALARSTDSDILEAACQMALDRGRCNYPFIKGCCLNLTASSRRGAAAPELPPDMPQHGNIRGSSAYK